MPSALGDSVRCPSCGQTVPPSAVLCPHCGRPFRTFRDEPLMTGSRPGDAALGVLLAFACLVVSGGILTVLTRYRVQAAGPIVIAPPILCFLLLSKRYPVVARAFGIVGGILFILLPLLIFLGLLAICMIALKGRG
ncbi:MAG: zinc-ribbon domain-containing protein [Capsulimonadales bacterium]|nr:zinc-ribbon domain-containing protein [Capsulimonadales bacterium]